jgi:membrane fusion protein (multidrug efflux system)
VLASTVAFAAGCGRSVTTLAAATGPDQYVVTSPMVTDVPERSAHVAEVQAVRHVEIKARTGGWIERIEVDEGQLVTAGQVMFVLGARQAQIDLLRANAHLQGAEAEVTTADIELRNREALVAKDVVSALEVELARAGLAAAQAKLAEAKAEVAAAELSVQYAEVRAPFDGAVNRLPFKVGSQVESGVTLTTLSDTAEVFAYFRISEREYLQLQGSAEAPGRGMPELVEFERADGIRLGAAGRIDALESIICTSTGAVTCRARFANADGVLKHGATGKVVLTRHHRGAVVVPQRATFERQHDICVFVVGEDGLLTTRRIVPELRLPDHYVVASGVTASDRILLEGARSVRDGARIAGSWKAMQEIAPL